MIQVEYSGTLPRQISKTLATRLVNAAYRIGGGRVKGEISVSVVDDNTMRALNQKHRNKNTTTDVLSFGLVQDDSVFPDSIHADTGTAIGEIIISLPQVRRQAKTLNRTIREEFALMLVHATLHIIGYDHETQEDETVMFGLQHETLIREGIL